ncbi:TNF receptor-associated factor 3-like [Dysidea avara]|uniref:TNF receptor-associated factor 3-like n=1 Tax=Dysidea avara TaxID=196820 RepID=UPI003318AE0A
MARSSTHSNSDSVAVHRSSMGYRCELVKPAKDDLMCKICHLLAREACQTSCCGQIFCTVCIASYTSHTVGDGRVACPYCRHQDYHVFSDTKTDRCVLELKVYCPNKIQGCTWVGELHDLEKHLNDVASEDSDGGCLFVEVQCRYLCGKTIQRRSLLDHIQSECELRRVNCKYCGLSDSYKFITSTHLNSCPNYSLQCPNKCNNGNFRVNEISKHLNECPRARVNCTFAKVGCNRIIRREQIPVHMRDDIEQHVTLNKSTILCILKDLETIKEQSAETASKLEKTTKELEATKLELLKTKEQLKHKEQEIAEIRQNIDMFWVTQFELKEQVKDIEYNTWPLHIVSTTIGNSNKEVIPLVIKMDKFESQTNCKARWTSPPFYTQQPGYRMCLSIMPSGYLKEDINGYIQDSFVTVGAILLKGEYDDDLSWPIQGVLTVQLLNQVTDNNHANIKLQFRGNKFCQRVTQQIDTTNCWIDCEQIIAHKSLPYNDEKKCQYLKNDCLFFQVCNFN